MKFDYQCRWVRHRLPLLVGGELGMDERRKVERHLIGCPACQTRRGASEGALAALRSVAAATPARPDTPPLWPALARQIRQSRHRRPSWRDRLALAAGPALGLACGVGGLVCATLAVGRPVPPLRSITVAFEAPRKPAPMAPTPRTPRALPAGPARSRLLNAASFDPPAGTRFDYVLDRGTPLEPGGDRDPQHSY